MDIIKTDAQKPTHDTISAIIAVLQKGGMVVLPTETVYTFAVDATNEEAIKKVYEIKGRDNSKPLHVVVNSLQMAKQYAEVTDVAEVLAKGFLPGPLTLVLAKKTEKLPSNLNAGLPTLGIRIPALPLCIETAKQFGKPFTTTSANLAGGPNPYSIQEVLSQIPSEKQNMIDLIIDAGVLPHLLPSTLVDLTTTPYKILRSGPILKEDIEAIVKTKLSQNI